MIAVYRHGNEEIVLTSGEAPPKDESRDAATVPDSSDPLYDLRTEAASLQFKINEFLTQKLNSKRQKH